MSHIRNLFYNPSGYETTPSVAFVPPVSENSGTSSNATSVAAAVPEFPVVEAQLKAESRLVYYSDPRSPAADRFRLLRMRLKTHWSAGKLKKLLITSPLAHDGKTTLVLNLATALAERNKRTVLVVEADLHHASVAESLRLRPWAGLTECLLDDTVSPLSAIRRIEPLGWYLLPAGEPRKNPTELLQAPAFAQTMQKLSPCFDWILIDSPPVIHLTDSLSLQQHADASLLVVRAGQTPRETVEQTISLLGHKKCPGDRAQWRGKARSSLSPILCRQHRPPGLLNRKHRRGGFQFRGLTCAISIWLLSLILFRHTLSSLAALSFRDDRSSHILLIPLISAFLIYLERNRVFRAPRYCFHIGIAMILIAAVLRSSLKAVLPSMNNTDRLSLLAALIVLVWISIFILCYGVGSFRAAAFPLLFLVLMIPLPTAMVEHVVSVLQKGSAEVCSVLFRLMGVPVMRQGFRFSLPGVDIEVAEECSGIHSALSLFIAGLLAGHILLQGTRKKVCFALLIFPVAIFKNAARIVIISWLGIYVNPGFFHGALHRRGGLPFSLLAIAMMALLLWFLRHSAVFPGYAITSLADKIRPVSKRTAT